MVVGMGAIVMDDVKIGALAVSAPVRSLRREQFPAGRLLVGVPAKDHGKVDLEWKLPPVWHEPLYCPSPLL